MRSSGDWSCACGEVRLSGEHGYPGDAGNFHGNIGHGFCDNFRDVSEKRIFNLGDDRCDFLVLDICVSFIHFALKYLSMD